MTAAADSEAAPRPVLALDAAAVRLGRRIVWAGLTARVNQGELVAVLGSNGSGKTTLLRTVLGELTVTDGSLRFLGRPVGRGDRRIGYVPQRNEEVDALGLRGLDLVALGLDGHRPGLPWRSAAARRRVRETVALVGATAIADRPMARLSGGERQRLRIAQALVSHPALLLLDEPFSALDPARQQSVARLVDTVRRETGCAVLLVTHDINPLLGLADSAIYLANGRAGVGPVEEIFTSERLSELYGTGVDVIHARGRIVVVGADPQPTATPHLHIA